MFIHWFCSPYCVCAGGGCVGSLYYGMALGVLSTFDIHLAEEERASCCSVIVLCLFCSLFLPHGAMVGLQYVSVVLSGHTHLLFIGFASMIKWL